MSERPAGTAPTVAVRAATPDDVPAIARLHMKHLPAAVSDFTLLGRRIVETFYRNALERGLADIFVLSAGADVAGFVVITSDISALFPRALLHGPADVARFLLRVNALGFARAVAAKLRSKTVALEPVPELVYLAVERAGRGRGYGRSLMERAEARFRELGAERYELNVHAENEAALRLYTSAGMQVKRTYVKAGARMYTLSKELRTS